MFLAAVAPTALTAVAVDRSRFWMLRQTGFWFITLVGITFSWAPDARAAGGRMEINQTAALAGGVAPGDAAGFPVELTVPGSYVLTGDLSVPVDTDGIQFGPDADGSTLDLNGFSIRGPASGSGVGVRSDNLTTGITVHGGRIEKMGGNGILLQNLDFVRNVVATQNGGHGIEVGPRSSVIDCQTTLNGGAGIHVDENESNSPFNNVGQTVVKGNLAAGNAKVDTAAFDIEGGGATGGNVCADGSCSRRGARRYYLTRSPFVSASNAPTRCAAGFHMASMWELSNLAGLEFTLRPRRGSVNTPINDQGEGPTSSPSGGWIRTGGLPNDSGAAGIANCDAYETSDSESLGTTANLHPTGFGQTSGNAPWRITTHTCDFFRAVWCIED